MKPRLKMYVWAEGNHIPPISWFTDILSFTDKEGLHRYTQLSPERKKTCDLHSVLKINNSLLCIKPTQLREIVETASKVSIKDLETDQIFKGKHAVRFCVICISLLQ